MIAILLFSAISALLVLLAGRRDQARDPRLTVLTLVLLVLFPLSVFLPKVVVVPVSVLDSAGAGFPWGNVVLGIWAISFLTALIRLGLAAKGVSNWRKRSTLVGQAGEVEIRLLKGLKSPVAAGVIRPVIFVPEGWSDWSDDARRMVLEHELAHHQRRDPLWRWIAEIACAVHGYNPLVLWISRRLAVQCEFACDAMVLEHGFRPRDYARLLCEFAEERPPAGLVLAMAASSSLESRVKRLMKPAGKSENVRLVMLMALTVAFAGGLSSFGPSLRHTPSVPKSEVDLRWSANPFPGEK